MSAPVIPLYQQIEAVRFAEVRQRSLAEGKSIKELRAPQFATDDLASLNAAARTLEKLKQNADQIRAFLQLPSESRQAVLLHGEALADMCMQLSSSEGVARAGGPLR